MVHGGLPVMSCTTPIRRDVAQGQPDEFRGCLVGREVTTGLDDLAQLRVDIFNRVRRVDDLAHTRRKRKERNHTIPGVAPRATDGREFLAPRTIRKRIEFGLSGFRTPSI